MDSEYKAAIGVVLTSIIELLQEYDCGIWAGRLTELLADIEVMDMENAKRTVMRVFGGMGSLNDVSLFVERNEQMTASINSELSRLLEKLYQLANTKQT